MLSPQPSLLIQGILPPHFLGSDLTSKIPTVMVPVNVVFPIWGLRVLRADGPFQEAVSSYRAITEGLGSRWVPLVFEGLWHWCWQERVTLSSAMLGNEGCHLLL